MDRYRATKDNFPRVLVVNGYGFNQSCGGSITLSNLFHGWPKEKLAILFADTYGNDPNIVGNSLALERKIVMPWCNIGFRWDTRAEIKVYAKHQAENQYGLHVYRRIYYSFRTVIKNLLGSLGITDILQKYPLTNEVEKFISSFKPEVVYTHLGNIAFADLTLEITKKNNIPLVVHIMDDYPSTAYKTGFFASLARKIMNNQLSILFRDAAICMGICQAMCDEFRKRYNREFVSFHNPVNPCF